MVAMLASTIQFTNTHPQPTTPDPTPPPTPPTQAPASHTRHRPAKEEEKSGCYGACGRPGLQRQHTPRPDTARTRHDSGGGGPNPAGPVPSGPNSAPTPTALAPPPRRHSGRTRAREERVVCDVPLTSAPRAPRVRRLRKEGC